MDIQLPRKIFILDDDVLHTETLQAYLVRKTPHEITTFHDGEECLKRLSDSPDIVILDHSLNTIGNEENSGMELLEAIKKSDPAIHIIVLSDQERYAIAAQTIQKGAEYYVIKDETAFEEVARIIEGI